MAIEKTLYLVMADNCCCNADGGGKPLVAFDTKQEALAHIRASSHFDLHMTEVKYRTANQVEISDG